MLFSENKGVVKENYIQILNNELEVFDNRKSGFSLLIKINGKKILFDFGIGKEIVDSLKKAALKFEDIDYYVMSHGHLDHTEGLASIPSNKNKPLICHPHALEGKFYGSLNIGCPLKKEEVMKKFDVKSSKDPYEIIKDSVTFLGEIPRKYSVSKEEFPGRLSNGEVDYCQDDSAIAIRTSSGIILVTGCSHSGIENIIEYTESLFPGQRICGIIGGMHILNDSRLKQVLDFLKRKNIENIIPIHCFSKSAIDKFKNRGKTLQKFYFDV